jgi:hypothetical protein
LQISIALAGEGGDGKKDFVGICAGSVWINGDQRSIQCANPLRRELAFYTPIPASFLDKVPPPQKFARLQDLAYEQI